jgi:hypothetical protein
MDGMQTRMKISLVSFLRRWHKRGDFSARWRFTESDPPKRTVKADSEPRLYAAATVDADSRKPLPPTLSYRLFR